MELIGSGDRIIVLYINDELIVGSSFFIVKNMYRSKQKI